MPIEKTKTELSSTKFDDDKSKFILNNIKKKK